jgi:hypothetical protein
VTAVAAVRRGWSVVRDDVVAALPAWLTVRVLVATAWVLVRVMVDEFGQPDPQQLTEGLAAWDGTFYRDIAQEGYGALPEEALRFFPLYPLLGRMASVLALGDVTIGLIIVANVLALVTGALVHRLVMHETGDTALARRAVWATALFPGAFVMAWAYSEPLMIAAAVGTLLALRKKQWGWAALGGVLAALSRPLGLLLVIPAIIEILPGLRTASRREQVQRLGAVAGPPIGLTLYLAWSGIRYGDFWAPISVQSQFRGEGVDPISRLWDGVGELFGSESLGDGLHIPFAIGFVVLAVVAFRRWPLSLAAFGTATLVVALAAENLNSLERYGLNAITLAFALATLARPPWAERVMIAIGSAGVVALSALAWTGAYVP